jgi:hypothetical protein
MPNAKKFKEKDFLEVVNTSNFKTPDDAVAMATLYLTEPYSGAGKAIIKLKSGRYSVVDIGHCSCYGPGDRWEMAMPGLLYSEFKKLASAWSDDPSLMGFYNKDQQIKAHYAVKEMFEFLTGKQLTISTND